MSKTTLFDSHIKKYAYREASEIYRDIGASPNGLSDEQVETMREKHGANSFTERKNDTTMHRLRRVFINPFNVILFVLGIVSLVTDVVLASNFAKNATTAIIIFSMILISGVIRLIQELRAKNAAEQLDRLIHESITVKRGGELIEIPAEELVVGDLVLFSAGDRVPADIRLTKVTDLFLSQAAITGESAILEKSCRTLSYSSQETLTQLENLAFMATTVISGKGEGIVLAVGKDTLYGSFARPDSNDKNSFQKGANSIAWVMLRFMAVLVPIVFVLLGITGGKWLESFAFALSVAVGLMPEMLPMVITACLAKGSLSMSKKQTIIKDINAMQGFGSMDAEAVPVSRTKYGSNKVTHEKKKSLAKRLAGAFVNPFTAILFCLALVSTMTDMVFPYFSLLGSTPEDFDCLTVVIILTMVMISGTLRFVQESRSGNAAEKLLAMITTTCTVTRRELKKAEIPMDDLVVGDIVHLSTGDMIPANVRILDAKDLFVSQSSLTGESEPIEKTPNVSAQKESVTDYTNIAFMGSNVVSGSATAVVVCVGDHSLFCCAAVSPIWEYLPAASGVYPAHP